MVVRLKQKTPTIIDLELDNDTQIQLVKQELTYTDKAAEQLYQRFKKNKWFIGKNGEEAFFEELASLKADIQKCLLIEGKNNLQTYSGLVSRLENKFGIKVENQVKYPDPEALPWNNVPDKKLRYYQEDIVEALLAKNHAGVEAATGSGKSMCIVHLVKNIGLQTLIMCPSQSIGDQLFNELTSYFGSKRVGKCFGGKKDFKKKITIALPQTLIRADHDSEMFKVLSKTQLFIADESHLCPSKVLSTVCFDLVKNAPYRFFFSATQMRNDGKDLLLEAITGPIVYKIGVKQLVEEGFLAKPNFKMVKITSDLDFYSDDPNILTRKHLYYNPKVVRYAADLANNFVEHLNHKVVILIDEVQQFTQLLPYINNYVGFAHGPLGENKSKVPEKYWDSDPNELVAQFNDGNLPILVGTSCITTGTDIRPVDTIIYLRGGRSEIELRQCIGRGTRKPEGKTEFNFIDFDVINDATCHRHAMRRNEIYSDVYAPAEFITA